MPKLTSRKPTKTFWETEEKEILRGGELRPVMVAITPKFVELKLKGTRTVYTVPWNHIYMSGLKMDVEAKRK